MTWPGNIPRVLVAVLLCAGLAATPTVAASSECTTSSPASMTYTVTVCISGPQPGAVVSGDVPVLATVTSTQGVNNVEWSLGTQYLLRDLEAPYELVLPSAKFVDGEENLSVRVVMAGGFTPTKPQLPLVLSNGVTSPPVNTSVFTPYPGPPGDASLVVAATGDAAGGRTMATRVAQRIGAWNPDMFLYLGDVYEKGTYTEHYNHYGHEGSVFSGLRSITNPTVGNHEYKTPGAAGYFDYWNNVPHHYSVDAAGWHIVTIDSTNEYGQLGTGSAQYQWLTQDLAGGGQCQLAFMHHPRFSVGGHGDSPAMDEVWRALAAAGVDILLAGHDHHYQRWAPLNADGQPAAGGITQFIAGAGGHSTRPFSRTDSRVAFRLTGAQAHGALRLTLEPNGATYQYVNVDGVVKDSGSIGCDGVAPPTTSFAFSGSGVAGKTRSHRFTIDRAGEMTATLDWTNPSSDLNLSLFNSAGTRLASATSTTKKPEVITRALAPGSYRLAVRTRLANTNYTVDVVVRH